MQTLELYQIDAFAEKPFSGNPAAIVMLKNWLPDTTMQNIAMENNLAETAFIVPVNDLFHIRYFSLLAEVELCGHATLASGFVLFNLKGYTYPTITFRTLKRGDLFVSHEKDIYLLDFPADEMEPIPLPKGLTEALKLSPVRAFRGKTDLMLLFESEDQIKNLNPNFEALSQIVARGIIVTAKGNEVDFVSRFFAPAIGINEDPVTGSAHTSLIPFWSRQLGKTSLLAKQLSKRSGTIYCEMKGNRVSIGGKAIHFLSGTISL